MPSFHTLTALIAALATLSNAAPTPGKGFSVQQVASKKMFLNSGQIAYRKAAHKYNIPIPSAVAHIAAAQQTGSAPAVPGQYDASYLSPVTVGGQQFTMDFDTGSADLWLFSTLQPASQQNGQSVYDPSKSSTAQQLQGESWTITYGDQSGAGGKVYADTVVIGGVTATSQAVEAATSVSSQFSQDQDNDGLVGLAFSSINNVKPDQQTTFFDTVADSLPSKLFAVDLKYHAPGSYDFGFIDQTKYIGSIVYAPVDNSQGFWEFTVDHTSVTPDPLDAIADTGTSLILVDDAATSAYWKQVDSAQNSQSAGGWVFDCGSSLPDWSITVNGKTLTVPGQFINFAPNGDGTCYGGIQSNQGIGINILGDVFLKNQYVIFDSGNQQIGFASQSGGASNSTSRRDYIYKPSWLH